MVSIKGVVIGMDWINKRKGWAVCALSVPDGFMFLYTIKDGQLDAYTQLVQKIIIDVPIRLPSRGRNRVGECRDCDKGARRWVGKALCSAVFPVPYAEELKKWR